MEIHFQLRNFREANGIFQSELAEVLGINQSAISRIENQGKPLSSGQYKKLTDKYGKELVSAYVGEETLANLIGPVHPHPSETKNTSEKDEDLISIIKAQQAEIERLNGRIKELTDLFVARFYPEKVEEIKKILSDNS